VAPERVRGWADDGRSDVFSLGALLYEAVCGTSPWTEDQEREMGAGVINDTRPKPMSRFRRGVPPALESVIERALAWDASERPTAEELALELAALAPTLDDTPPRPGTTVPADPDATELLPAAKWPG
jgi:serine/threonine protein kinase